MMTELLESELPSIPLHDSDEVEVKEKAVGTCWHCTTVANAGISRWKKNADGKVLHQDKLGCLVAPGTRGAKHMEKINNPEYKYQSREFIVELHTIDPASNKHNVRGPCTVCGFPVSTYLTCSSPKEPKEPKKKKSPSERVKKVVKAVKAVKAARKSKSKAKAGKAERKKKEKKSADN